MNDITLDVVPQFYPSFPDMASKLPQSMSCLNPWILIEEHHRMGVTLFHLIIERKQSNRSIRLKEDIVDLPEWFGNAWHVKDTFDLLVVRDRSPAHFLSLCNGKDEYNSPWTYPVEGEVQPVRPGHKIPHQFTTSEETLVETSGNDTTAVEMPVRSIAIRNRAATHIQIL
ncbi:hypothetical protein CPC08DRAFT_714351 [Agrocybe pediades]|nr:hypothetical protein CPC08DRAFT_714351 [Agrocybe pediades]